jgi:hypothetical protein
MNCAVADEFRELFDDRCGGVTVMKKYKEDTIAFFREHLKA